MPSLFRIVLLLAALAGPLAAATQPPQKELAGFIKLARATAATPPAPSSPDNGAAPAPRSRPPAAYLVEQLASAPGPLPADQLQHYVAQIDLALADSPKHSAIRRAGLRLVTRWREAESRQLAAHRSATEALLRRAAQTCLAAKKPSDLDSLLQELAPGRPDRSTSYGVDHAALQRITQMHGFVRGWQDLLAARQSGDAQRIDFTLSMLRQSVDATLIPRSLLFEDTPPARAAAEPAAPATGSDAREVLVRRALALRDLDAVQPILDDYDKLPSRQTFSETEQALFNDLRLLLKHRAALGNGSIRADVLVGAAPRRPGHANIDYAYAPERSVNPDPAQSLVLSRLENQLRLETLRAVFRDSGFQPREDEETPAFIRRVARAAAAAGDWEYAVRSLEIYQDILSPDVNVDWLRRELAGCLAFLAAQRFEKAGDYVYAVAAYRAALLSTGEFVPVAPIKESLAAIREKSPDAFDTASPRLFLPELRRERPNRPPMRANEYLVPRAERPFAPAAKAP